MSKVVFSKRLSKEAGIHPKFRPHLRVLAAIITLGEVAVGYICFRRADFLSAYAMAAYLGKEHVIARLTRTTE